MGLLSFGKKKEQKQPVEEEEVFPELSRLKEEIEKGFNFEQSMQQLQQPQQMQPMSLPTPPPQPQQLDLGLPKIEEQPKIEKRSFYEEAHREEKPELYVKIENYKKVLDLLEKLKIKLKDLENILLDLKETKEKEVEKLNEAKEQLEDSREKVNNILGLLREV